MLEEHGQTIIVNLIGPLGTRPPTIKIQEASINQYLLSKSIKLQTRTLRGSAPRA